MKLFAKLALFSLSVLFSLATLAKEDAPMSVDGATTIDAAQAKALFDEGALFVDPRRDSDWAVGRIPDAVHLEMKSAFSQDSLAAEAKKDEALVFYCNGAKCGRSAKCAAKAVAWGYTKVYYFRDGFPVWKSAGYPVE